MEDFLPQGTKEPTKTNYFKFQDGSNVFRVLAPAVVGWEYWTDAYIDGQKKPTPHRVKEEQAIPISEVTTNKFGNLNISYFWAFPVWNVQAEKIQILELTQASIRKAMLAYIQNPKWGSPTNYNIEVIKGKTADGKVEYGVIAEPKEPLDPKVIQKFKDMKLDMNVWMAGGDPFAGQVKEAENVFLDTKKIADEVPF